MLLWAVLGALTAATLLVLVYPLTRREAAETPPPSADVALFRAQLAELARDLERGVITETEAAAARLEIERKLLAARPVATVALPPERGHRVTAALILVAVPVLSLSIYLYWGSPELPDVPYRAPASAKPPIDLEATRGQLEARLAKQPDSLEGWIYLAETDAALGRWPDVHSAFAKALALSDRGAEVLEADGMALVAEAEGTVTPEAQAVFEETLQKRPDSVRARYELGLGLAQQGDLSGALERWRALAESAPADAPWLATVREAIAAAERAQAGAGEAGAEAGKPPAEVAQIEKLPPGQRGDAIRSMVAGLAARLAREPNDLAGWERLGRSYLVLRQPRDALEAYAKAAALAPRDVEPALGRAQALQALDGEQADLSPATIEAFRKVAELAPDEPQALWALGLAARQHGDAAEARRLWQRLLEHGGVSAGDAAEVRRQLDALPPAR